MVDETTTKEVQQEEKQTNCLACNKPLKKISRYYRNGKYYCTKRCWKDKLKKEETNEKK
ncbi:MAG: hypothetical protein ABIH18_05835 [Candidatus Omnitrophota bacterium]